MHIDLSHWGDMVVGGLAMTTFAYMARTIPEVKNPWLKWFIGGIQFAVGNLEQAKTAIAPKSPEPPPSA